MAKRERAYYAPRSERGLSDRVFLDPSNRRKSRVLVSILTCVGALVLWFSLFAVAMVSNQGLRAALPNEILEIKEQFSDAGRLHPHHDHDHAHNQDHALPDIKSAAIETYWQQDAAKYRCQVTDVAGQGQKRIYAVVPSALSWAPNSLRQSCETVSVAIPEWFTLRARGGKAAVDGVNEDTRQPVLSYAKAQAGQMELMPKIALDVTAARLFTSKAGRAELAQTLADFTADEDLTDQHVGYCLSADRMTAEGTKAFAEVIRPFGQALQARGLQACVALPAGSPDALLVVANRFADKVIMRGYQQPWVGSAVEPLAAQGWFEDHIADLLGSIDADKLVVELGTHAVDWISGRPKPEAMPFAQVMTALADAQVAPEFDADSGNTRATYIDDKGLQHRIWMLDAASLHNQLQVLSERGISSVGLGGLGSEDPGIWAVLDQAQHGVPFSGDSLANVVFTDFVQRVGKGPFVAPLSMPVVGERRVSVAAQTGLITDVAYDEIPRASVAQLYGTDQPNKVVLTFDDGPHPEYTPEALDILKEMNTPAAFFVLGTAALQSPALLERILDEGHELGSHTYSHPKMGDISASRATVEVNSVQLLVNGITGRSMRLYREPYMRSGGPITSKEVASLMPLEEAGYVIAGMDVVPRDWLAQTADELADEIIRQVEDNAGGIVLLHDGGGDQSQTVAALPKVITTLRDRGYEFASISEFLNVSPDELMPQTDRVTSTFGNVSFIAVGKSWSLLEIIFWTVFGIGLFRALVLLILTAKRRRHATGVSDEQPSVTIVIPAYNEERVIAKAVRRALATDYDNFDVIVVDDGSTDDTLQAAMAFADLPNVTVLTQPNGGKAAALNTALDESDSEILICIDADSQVAPDAVALMAAHFEDPTIGAVAGRVVVGNRKNILTRLQALEYITAQSIERRAKEYLNAITVVPGAIGAWRATALMEAGVFSTETLTEDADMTMAVIRSDYRVIYEERAVATTETPARLKGLMEQRLRWSLGMMQAAWKHKGATIEGRKLGLVSIPDLAVFGYLMPLIAPLADLFLLILAWNFYHSYDSATFDLAALMANPLILAYITLPVVEILTVVIAFRLDPTENRALMLLIPLQRLFYRQVLYISVIRALWRAATGSLAKWGRAPRAGFTFNEPRTT